MDEKYIVLATSGEEIASLGNPKSLSDAEAEAQELLDSEGEYDFIHIIQTKQSWNVAELRAEAEEETEEEEE